MSNLIKEPQVLYDARGKRSHVLLPYKSYEKMLELLEDAVDIKAMKEVESEKSVTWKDALKRL